MNEKELLEQIKTCIKSGKVDQKSPFPPAMKGQKGADELTREALDAGISAERVLNESLIKAMEEVGNLFTQKKIFVPQMLISAKAMSAGMKHIKPYFQSGSVKQKGTFIVCTVLGDLHDIGKNLVAMIVEGAGFNVIDLGVDIGADKIKEQLKDNPDAIIGLSALLTTTMTNMKSIVSDIKETNPDNKIIIGGAPVNQSFCDEIGADAYAEGPQEAVEYMKTVV